MTDVLLSPFWPSPSSDTGQIRFQRAQFQTPSSVSFLALTEFRGEKAVSSVQLASICVPKRTHRALCRTYQVWRRTQRGLFSETCSRNSILPVSYFGISLQFTNAVALSPVGHRKTQMSAKECKGAQMNAGILERKCKSAKECFCVKIESDLVQVYSNQVWELRKFCRLKIQDFKIGVIWSFDWEVFCFERALCDNKKTRPGIETSIKIRTRSTTTSDRNPQFQGVFSTGFFVAPSPAEIFCFSRMSVQVQVSKDITPKRGENCLISRQRKMCKILQRLWLSWFFGPNKSEHYKPRMNPSSVFFFPRQKSDKKRWKTT